MKAKHTEHNVIWSIYATGLKRRMNCLTRNSHLTVSLHNGYAAESRSKRFNRKSLSRHRTHL